MEQFLTEKQASKVTGFSCFWFQKKRVTGGGPPFRKIDGHAIRYPAVELMDWMNQWKLVRSTSEAPRHRPRIEPRHRA